MFTCGCAVDANDRLIPCATHARYLVSSEMTVDELLTFCKRSGLYFSLAWILRTVRKMKDAQETEVPALPAPTTNTGETGQTPEAPQAL